MASFDAVEVCPVGVLHTPFATREEAPIQGAFAPDCESVIEFFDEFAAGLDDIEGFSHLILIYLMDRAGTPVLKPVPLLDDRPHGVFATRNPRRPNRLGLCVVRLGRRQGNLLHVTGADALDASPVIDVKPYVPRFDSAPGATEGWFAGRANRPKPAGRE